MNARLLMHVPEKVVAALDVLSAGDPGIERDAKLEARIDAAFQRMTRKGSSDEESKDSFDEFYRLVLARSQTAQVKIEMERRAADWSGFKR
jgi:hypothetical protein